MASHTFIRCKHRGCQSQAKWNYNGETPKYCALHVLEGMVVVRNMQKKPRQCKFSGCQAQARWNVVQETKPKMCIAHKVDGMVVTAYCTKTPGHIYNTDETKWVTGSNYHGDCALNVLMNKGGRGPGKCELYQNTSRPRPPAKQCVCWTFCEGCKVLMHKDCYWIYHDVVEGLRLDSTRWVNDLRDALPMTAQETTGVILMVWWPMLYSSPMFLLTKCRCEWLCWYASLLVGVFVLHTKYHKLSCSEISLLSVIRIYITSKTTRACIRHCPNCELFPCIYHVLVLISQAIPNNLLRRVNIP